MHELDGQLRAADPVLLKQDVDRLDASVSEARAAHASRALEMGRVEVTLQLRGADGLEEAAAQTRQALDQSERRCAELARRARALDYLYSLLLSSRAALAQRLRAPLQRHLERYLQMLFPGAQVQIDEDLSPGRILRPGVRGTEGGAFEELSVGAREQMGIVARLAYADLLAQAGRPTLLILDDALVHTDEARLGQMKRVLYDAATRHQILIFTCHPRAWQDLGVAAREL